MSAASSSAEQLRAHRLAFELALELGCTPREAARILRDRTRTRRNACGTRAPDPTPDTDFEPLERDPADYRDWDAPWMMRER